MTIQFMQTPLLEKKKNQFVKVRSNQELKYSFKIVQQYEIERETGETRG